MQLHSFSPRTKNKKTPPVGRGGKRGKTSGRGGKGQTARAGHKIRPEVRDLIKKLPKRRGYGKNRARTVKTNRITGAVVNLAALEAAYRAGETVSPASLLAKGLEIDWWPDCATACLNSAAGGQFNRTPDSATLPPNAENISFYECADTTCPLSTAEALTRGADFSVIYRTENPELDNDVFEIELLSGYGNFISGVPALKPNTTYRVVVDRAVRSTDDEVLTGLNFDINDDDTNDFFSWTFTTQQSATLCQLEEVSVAPVRATLEEDGHRMSYFAQAWAYNDQCGDIRLNSYQYNWGWDDFNVDGVDAVNFVTQAGQLQDGCGNGRVEFGEDCDYNDPRLINPLLCSNSCKWIGSAVCPSAPIIPNSNFVLDVSPADGKPDDWLVEPVGNGTLAAEAVVAHPGSDGRSAKVTINSLADWGAQLVSRTAALASIPSGDYVLTAWVKTNITASSTKVIISNQGTEWTDGTDKVWPAWASYHPDQPCKFNLTSDSWTRLTCPFTIPPPT